MKTISIPRAAYVGMLHDYAEARHLAITSKKPYWQGKEEALMMALHQCFGIMPDDIDNDATYRQARLDVEQFYAILEGV